MNRGAPREQHQVVLDGERAQLAEHLPEDPHWDDDLTSEITRLQSCYSTKHNESHLQAVNRQLNLACTKPIAPNAPEIPDGEEFTPYMTTMTPTPIPMAVVSRPPFGPINHNNIFVPQNEAWLSLIRNAKRDVFIQSPDINAAPLFPALVAALKRGIRIDAWSCFGYNDAGEIIPGQGGTNDQFNSRLVKALTPAERANLHICYYVGKDQSHPIHQSFKQRTCHVKLLIADGRVGVQGSGNQDTQSWCHSQEINVMIDSEEVCRKWREGIERNQNTARFGRAAEDGVWRDEHGNEGEVSDSLVARAHWSCSSLTCQSH